MGYGFVSGMQFVITALIVLSLPLWRKNSMDTAPDNKDIPAAGLYGTIKIRGVKEIIAAFFCYCAFETTSGLWASSYLVQSRDVAPETAAFFASMFFSGITAGRFISGFACSKAGDRNMIRAGIALILAGIVLIALPVSNVLWALTGLVVAGLGAAPVYPAVIHATPCNFGRANSHTVIGVQMASAYCGSIFAPPLFGLAAQYINIALYPLFMAIFTLILFLMTERVNRICAGGYAQ